MRMLLLFIVPENIIQVVKKLFKSNRNVSPICHRAMLKICQCTLKSYHHPGISRTNLPRMFPQEQLGGKPQAILLYDQRVQVSWI